MINRKDRAIRIRHGGNRNTVAIGFGGSAGSSGRDSRDQVEMAPISTIAATNAGVCPCHVVSCCDLIEKSGILPSIDFERTGANPLA